MSGALQVNHSRWMVDPRASSKTAFTLVELLVVIAILATLIGLLLPAIQSARESARRTQCMNHQRQIAVALALYADAHNRYPPASTGPTGVNPNLSNGQLKYRNWLVTLLPFLEEKSLEDQINPGLPMSAPEHETVRATRVPVLVCPSDQFSGQPFMGAQGGRSLSFGDNWARGNYAANASLGFACLFMHPPLTGATPSGWSDRNLRGVMGHNQAVRPREISDGLSKTILFAEVRSGLAPMDPRGVWALSGAGSSSLWAHGGLTYGGLQGDAYGPNCGLPDSDDIMNCAEAEAAAGGAEALRRKGMSCFDWNSMQATARSMHREGVVVTLGDGSVHWIADTIQVTPSIPGSLSVWDRLMLSMDGSSVDITQ